MKSIFAILFCLFAFAACDSGDDMNKEDNSMVSDTTTTAMMGNNQQNGMQGEDNRMMKDMTIAQIVMQNEKFSSLEKALKSTGMAKKFESGSWTILAPTNDAFDDLSDETNAMLMKNNNKQLSNVLRYHVIEGTITVQSLMDGKEINSVQGSPLMFEVDQGGDISVSGSEVEYAIQTKNGIIYVLDEVLIPEDLRNM